MKTLLLHISLNFLYITVLLMFNTGLYAQQHGLKLYTVNDGLPSSFTYRTYQDKAGYLWIATTAGLSRFDGRQFVNYTLSDGLLSLKVDGIFQDSKDRLWVGTNAGMAQFKNNKFVNYPTNDKLNISGVANFLETKDNRIWACTSKGVYEFGERVWRKVSLYPGFENRNCIDIIETNGELYCNYRSDIVCRDRYGQWLHIASKNDYGSHFNIMSLQNNQVLLSTQTNIYLIRDHHLVPLYPKNINDYFTFLVDSKKRLWLSGANFLKISKPGDWQHFSDSIYNEGYHYLGSEDSNHNIWISKPDGLLRIKDIAYTIIDKNTAVPLEGIYNIIPLADNRLLLSGVKNGLQIFANNSCKQIMPPRSPVNEYYYGDPVNASAFDDKNRLWMITNLRKFLHFNGKTLEDFSDALHLKTAEGIYDMDFVKSRKQFFICADSTLIYGSPSKFSTFIPHNTGIPIFKPTLVHGLKNGLILLYIEGRGVYGIDAANNYIPLIKETGIDGSKKGNNLDICFYEGTDNTFWIAFPGLGLYEYGFKKNNLPYLKNHLTINDGLQSNKILSLTNDRQNRLWIATYTGLDILQKNKAGSWEVFNYAKSEDLTIIAIDYEKLVCDTEGSIWLSSPNKIIKFNPANIRLNKETPRIIIEKVALAFKETDWSKLSDSLYSYFQLPFNPMLNYSQNSLGIFFNAIDLSTSNSNPEYSYKLLPLDTSWSNSSKIESVSFAQLPPGKYQFLVRAKDNASGWSQPTLFSFTITPPFWGKWWFRLIVIAIASLIIVTIFRSRIKKIKKDSLIKNQLKELEMKALKAQMNPHFIYNALNSIQALFANDKKMEGIHYIGSFSRLLRQVLDNSENNVISLDKELETIGLYVQLEALRLDMQLQYKVIVAENIVPEFEKIPPLILQPFVENALWHGLSHKEGEKEIKITVTANDTWLVCDITDNGIGRLKAEESKSASSFLHQSKA
ncbi:MAG TPA: two-component regulator propeller domain-containing protein, partial [Ginsengibacter sp.]